MANVSMLPAVKHLKCSTPKPTLFSTLFQKEKRKISIALMNYIEYGEQAGARVLTGGKAGSIQSSCYVIPTVFDNVKQDIKVVEEEIFGPVVVAVPLRHRFDYCPR
jgi:acyl-CoA reductase-like NAD-dependent aldehyde dehydrogenase